MLFALRKLRKREDSSYALPREWNVGPTQFSSDGSLFYQVSRATSIPKTSLTCFLARKLKTFEDISALSLSSPPRLDLPELYDDAKESLSAFFLHTPTPHCEFLQLEEALVLAIDHDVRPVSNNEPPYLFCLLFCSVFIYPFYFLRDVHWSSPPCTSPATSTMYSVRRNPGSEDVILHSNHPQRHWH